MHEKILEKKMQSHNKVCKNEIYLTRLLEIFETNITNEGLNGFYRTIINKITIKDKNIIDIEWK